jgi:hypothetical protein
VLQEIVDVTKEVNAAVKPEMKPAEVSGPAAVMSQIEGLAGEDETSQRRRDAHQGAVSPHRYKKYTDVRLVFSRRSKHRIVWRRRR